MQTIRYISDLHLFDVYSLEWRDQFNTLDKYANNLIDNWNSVVDSSDITIIVGDVGYNCQRTYDVLNMLYGLKILVMGNHDTDWHSDVYRCAIFAGVHYEICSNGIYVKHIPDANNSGCQFFVHGHHHRYDVPGMQTPLLQYAADTYRLNCCADLIGNRPCTLQELQLNKELLLEKYKKMGYLKEDF